ncbi:hypothetical protein JCM24511_01436 [Saitozyma sp. JCM 24511]|nr:hypothetical protein JCM24511_01436 [Saitozyma sp. JCM 24511]
MRVLNIIFSLGLVASALAAPAPISNFANSPILFAKDPLSIHKRSALPEAAPEPIALSESSSDITARSASSEDSELSDTDQDEGSCSDVCGIRKVQGARTEREALCSMEGLRATLECAQCIDSSWPDTTWEESAMAEYERIVDACADAPQLEFKQRG